MPAASVVIYTKNHTGTLRAMVQSLKAQTRQDFEWVVVDDNSNDRTPQMLEEILPPGSTLIVMNDEVGKINCLHTAIEACTTDVVIISEPDYLSSPQRIEKLLAVMEGSPEVMVCGSQIERRHNLQWVVSNYPTDDESIKAELWFNNTVHHSTVALRTSLFKETGLRFKATYEQFFADHDLWFKVMQMGKICLIDEPLVKDVLSMEEALILRSSPSRKMAADFYVDKLNRYAGYSPSMKEVKLQVDLMTIVNPRSLSHPLRYKAWLEKFEQLSAKKRLAQEEAMHEVILMKWAELGRAMHQMSTKRRIQFDRINGKRLPEIWMKIALERVFGKGSKVSIL